MPYVTTSAGLPLILPIAGQPGLQGEPGREGAVGPAGRDGAVGPPGPDGARFTRTAIEFIPGRRLVADAGNGQCRILDPTDPSQAGLTLGYVVEDTPAGAQALIQQGDLPGVTFDFGYGTTGPLYATDNATLTLTPRQTGFSQVMGWTPDGITVAIRLGPARAIVSLSNAPAVTPSIGALMKSVFALASDGPEDAAPGTFYINGTTLERKPNPGPTVIETSSLEAALSALWDGLPSSPPLMPGELYLNGRTLNQVQPAPLNSITPGSGFLIAFGAFWDSRPQSPEGIPSKSFYLNGNALERTP